MKAFSGLGGTGTGTGAWAWTVVVVEGAGVACTCGATVEDEGCAGFWGAGAAARSGKGHSQFRPGRSGLMADAWSWYWGARSLQAR